MPNLNLKNFAKIKDSDFDIQDITVFAGKPGSGKSYIMKTLYAINEAPDKLHSEIELSQTKLDEIKNKHGELNAESINKLSKSEILELKLILDDFNKIPIIKHTKVEDDTNLFEQEYKNLFSSIFGNLNQISKNFTIEHEDVTLTYLDSKLIATLVDEDKEMPGNSIFVETPLILEFKKFMTREGGKTPYHIESLLKILDRDYSFTDKKQDEFIKSFVEKSKKIINGNIEDSGDSFIFKTDNKDFDIVNASSGIKSIGLLQYLVTNKALKKGSTLFWEEPEVHLHPTWQLKMIDLFIELMNAGVKIVFSTHSPFMADYLNAKATREKFGERISFNLLNEKDAVVSNTILNDENWNLLQDELMGAFEDIMWQYL